MQGSLVVPDGPGACFLTGKFSQGGLFFLQIGFESIRSICLARSLSYHVFRLPAGHGSLCQSFCKGRDQKGQIRSGLQPEIIPVLVRGDREGDVSQDLSQVDLEGAVRDQVLAHAQTVGPSNHIRQSGKTEISHDLPQLSGDKGHKAHDMFRLSLKAAAQLFVLGRDADRTGILGTDTHHHAAHGHQGSCRETVFLCAQKGRNGDIAPAHKLAVGLQDNTAAEAVFHKTAVGFREPQLPGETRIVYGASRCGACAAVITGDQDDLGAGLGDTGGDGPDPGLGDQLDIDPGVAVCVFQVINQLGQVLDGINIVMGRRRDQGDTGRRIPCLSHPGIDLFARKMAALAGLGSLGHFDLDLVGAAQIGAGHTKTSRSHLLDAAVGICSEAFRRLASLAGIGLCADGIHGPRQGFVGFSGKRTEAHGTCLEMADNALFGFHLFQRDRRT